MADHKNKGDGADPVASEKDNAALEHTDDKRDQASVDAAGAPMPAEVPEGHSVTTRDDALDLGVPMLPGDPGEPVGPEDALGSGPKRGDYRGRVGDASYNPHQGAEPQRPRAEDIGDEAGVKGGVGTA